MFHILENKMVKLKPVTFVLGGLSAGGAERVAANLITYWVQNGRQVNVISRRGEEKDFFKIPESVHRTSIGGEGESLNVFTGLIKNISYVFKLRKAIRASNTQVIISFLTKQNIYTILACLGLGRKVIISERNDTTRQQFKRSWLLLRKWLYNYADVVTANSRVAITGMQQYVNKNKLKILPNPVEIPLQPARPQLSQTVLNVGRLTKTKNHAFLIEAFSQLKKNGSDWRLLIAGNGEEQANLEILIKSKGMEKCIELAGQVENITSCYQDASIFVITSKHEGTPNVLLEAMASGLPSIIADNLPGAMKLVENNVHGFYYREGDIEDLKNKFTLLMKQPRLRKEMGDAARSSVHQYSIENIDALWRSVID